MREARGRTKAVVPSAERRHWRFPPNACKIRLGSGNEFEKPSAVWGVVRRSSELNTGSMVRRNSDFEIGRAHV